MRKNVAVAVLVLAFNALFGGYIDPIWDKNLRFSYDNGSSDKRYLINQDRLFIGHSHINLNWVSETEKINIADGSVEYRFNGPLGWNREEQPVFFNGAKEFITSYDGLKLYSEMGNRLGSYDSLPIDFDENMGKLTHPLMEIVDGALSKMYYLGIDDENISVTIYEVDSFGTSSVFYSHNFSMNPPHIGNGGRWEIFDIGEHILLGNDGVMNISEYWDGNQWVRDVNETGGSLVSIHKQSKVVSFTRDDARVEVVSYGNDRVLYGGSTSMIDENGTTFINNNGFPTLTLLDGAGMLIAEINASAVSENGEMNVTFDGDFGQVDFNNTYSILSINNTQGKEYISLNKDTGAVTQLDIHNGNNLQGSLHARLAVGASSVLLLTDNTGSIVYDFVDGNITRRCSIDYSGYLIDNDNGGISLIDTPTGILFLTRLNTNDINRDWWQGKSYVVFDESCSIKNDYTLDSNLYSGGYTQVLASELNSSVAVKPNTLAVYTREDYHYDGSYNYNHSVTFYGDVEPIIVSLEANTSSSSVQHIHIINDAQTGYEYYFLINDKELVGYDEYGNVILTRRILNKPSSSDAYELQIVRENDTEYAITRSYDNGTIITVYDLSDEIIAGFPERPDNTPEINSTITRDTNITIFWTPSTHPSYQQVTASNVNDPIDYVSIDLNASESNYTIENLTAGAEYNVSVVTVDEHNNSFYDSITVRLLRASFDLMNLVGDEWNMVSIPAGTMLDVKDLNIYYDKNLTNIWTYDYNMGWSNGYDGNDTSKLDWSDGMWLRTNVGVTQELNITVRNVIKDDIMYPTPEQNVSDDTSMIEYFKHHVPYNTWVLIGVPFDTDYISLEEAKINTCGRNDVWNYTASSRVWNADANLLARSAIWFKKNCN